MRCITEEICTIIAKDKRKYVFAKRTCTGRTILLKHPEGYTFRRINPHRITVVAYYAREGKNEIGFAAINLRDKMSADLFVKEEYRGVGLGKALVLIRARDLLQRGEKWYFGYANNRKLAEYYRKLGGHVKQEQTKNWSGGRFKVRYRIDFYPEEMLKMHPIIEIGAKK